MSHSYRAYCEAQSFCIMPVIYAAKWGSSQACEYRCINCSNHRVEPSYKAHRYISHIIAKNNNKGKRKQHRWFMQVCSWVALRWFELFRKGPCMSDYTVFFANLTTCDCNLHGVSTSNLWCNTNGSQLSTLGYVHRQLPMLSAFCTPRLGPGFFLLVTTFALIICFWPSQTTMLPRLPLLATKPDA